MPVEKGKIKIHHFHKIVFRFCAYAHSIVIFQLYVATISPARDETASYTAWGHSMVVDPWGKVMTEAQESQTIVYADIGMIAHSIKIHMCGQIFRLSCCFIYISFLFIPRFKLFGASSKANTGICSEAA